MIGIGILLLELRTIRHNLDPIHHPDLINHLPIDSISSLIIITPSDSIHIERQSDSNWVINGIYPGESEKITILLGALLQTTILDFFPGDSVNQVEFGLQEPRFRIMINQTPVIEIGDPHPLQTGIYLSRNDSVMVTEPTFVNLLPQSHDDFITRRHIRIDIAQIDRISLVTSKTQCHLYRDRDSIWRNEGGHRVNPIPIRMLLQGLDDPEYLFDSLSVMSHRIADKQLIINARDTLFINQDELWSSYNPYRIPIPHGWLESIEWDQIGIPAQGLCTWDPGQIDRISFYWKGSIRRISRDSNQQWTGIDFSIIDAIITDWTSETLPRAKLSPNQNQVLNEAGVEGRLEFGLSSGRTAVIQLYRNGQTWLACTPPDPADYFSIPDSFINRLFRIDTLQSGVTD